MKISSEVAEIIKNHGTLDELVEINNKTINLYIEELGSSRSKTSESPAGKIYSHGGLVDRNNDTIAWDRSVHAQVFSSDDTVVRCPVRSNHNDLIINDESNNPRSILLKNVKD